MDNVDVARVLDEVADLLEILGQNAFRVRAYRTAARTIEAHGEPVTAIVQRDASELAELPGIGKDLAGKIAEIATTGDLALRRELCERVPATLAVMMHVDGVGPKRAKLFYDKLQLRTLAELEAAARRGALHEVRGIGEILERRILAGCEKQRVRQARARLSEADAHAQPLLEYLRACPAALNVDVCGSLRRRRETIGDIDVLVAARRPAVVSSYLLAYTDIDKVLAHGPTKSSFVLRSGMQVDVRIVEPACYGAALHYFTGSKSHNIAIRRLGLKHHLKISEYGVFRDERRVSGRTEEEVFRSVGLPWIPPELREDRGEVQAAREGRLPELVELSQIRGDLHMHTRATDGKNTLEEMVSAGAAHGYEYVAITDHTKAVRVAGGLQAAELRKQRRAIDALRREIRGIAILHGAEVDILEDGRLDLEDAALDELDLVIAAVHSKLDMPEGEMTERVLRALTSGRVHVLAHPTGRLLGAGGREPSAIDIDRIARAAHENGVLLEINAQPDRLDLSEVLIQSARVAGARFVVDTDAHRVSELDFMRYGIDQARRGWCTSHEIANTLPLSDLMALLQRPRAGRRAAQAEAAAIDAGRASPGTSHAPSRDHVPALPLRGRWRTAHGADVPGGKAHRSHAPPGTRR